MDASIQRVEPAGGGYLRSSVGRKALIACSGALLFGWLVLHMLGNLGAFSGAAALDGYAAALRRPWPLLWGARALLAAALLVHVGSAISLALRARRARSHQPGYAVARARAATLASRSMALGGALLLGFIVFHLLHMTFGSVHPSFVAGRVYHNLVSGLASPAIALAYVAAAALCGLHLYHGLYALPRSLGLANAAHMPRARRPLVLALSLAIAIGFASVPLAVVAGVLR